MKKYKGYVGHYTYDSAAKIFHGDVIGIKDVITFQADRSEEIEQAFKDSVNDYLDMCKRRGEKPDKTQLEQLHAKNKKKRTSKNSQHIVRSNSDFHPRFAQKLKK